MKRTCFSLLVFTILLLANSCKESDFGGDVNVGYLQISTEIQPNTRAIKESESFAVGDRIGIMVSEVTKLVGAINDGKWYLDENIPLTKEKASVYAFYPNNEASGNTIQNDEGESMVQIYLNSNSFKKYGIVGQPDYLWGQAEVSQANPVAHIKFKHVLARLSFSIKLDENDYGKGLLSAVSLENVGENRYVSNRGYLNLQTGKVGLGEDVNEDYILLDSLDCLLSKENAVTIDMLVMPMDLPEDGLVRLSLTIDGIAYAIPLKSMKLEAGNHYSYPIIVKRPNEDNSYEYDGNEMVDLGLSVKWCSHNVGAEMPTDWGGCYTWGGIKDIQEDHDSYCSELTQIGKTEYDVAHVTMGGKWRIPTMAEYEELISLCIWLYNKELHGYVVIGSNDNKIFIPCANTIDYPSMMQWYYCDYWTDQACDDNSAHIVDINSHFDTTEDYTVQFSTRSKRCGVRVRAVCD